MFLVLCPELLHHFGKEIMHNEGISQGIEQERKESVIRTISILRSLNHGDSDIKNALKCNYKIGDEEVNRYLGRTENRDV